MKEGKFCLTSGLRAVLILLLFSGCGGGDDEASRGPGGEIREEASSTTAEDQPVPVELNWIGHWKDEDSREDLIYEVKREYEFPAAGRA